MIFVRSSIALFFHHKLVLCISAFMIRIQVEIFRVYSGIEVNWNYPLSLYLLGIKQIFPTETFMSVGGEIEFAIFACKRKGFIFGRIYNRAEIHRLVPVIIAPVTIIEIHSTIATRHIRRKINY